MHYYKVNPRTYAAHREDPKTLSLPWISQVGYVEKGSQGWIITRPCGLGFDNTSYPTEKAAQEALEHHVLMMLARATWLK